MARPRNDDLKTRIREARAAGAKIDQLMTTFGLSRNTIFFHLRADTSVDGRAKYTEAQKKALAAMTDEQLCAEAQRLGKTFVALQRVAYRERKRQETDFKGAIRTKVELRGWIDFGMESELQAFDLSQEQLRLANRRLSVYKLKLTRPNRLETADGRFCLLRIAFQKAIITDTIETLTANAGKIKAAWRRGE